MRENDDVYKKGFINPTLDEVMNKLERPIEISGKELIRSNQEDETADNRYMLLEFTEIISMMHPSLKFLGCLKNMYETDGFFQKVILDIKDNAIFKIENGLLFMNENNAKLLCIPDGKIENVLLKSDISIMSDDISATLHDELHGTKIMKILTNVLLMSL